MSNLYQATADLPIPEKSSDYTGKVKSNLISPVFGAYANLLNWGVQIAEAKGQGKYIRITNFIALNTFFGSLIYVALAVFWVVSQFEFLLTYSGNCTNSSSDISLFVSFASIAGVTRNEL